MNFEQDAKQFCARPDKNNNMNLTLDIAEIVVFPQFDGSSQSVLIK